jgi:uncharacterized protein
MDMNVHQSSSFQFNSYSDSSVTINDKEFRTNIIVTNTEVVDFKVNDIHDLELRHLDEIIQNKPDLIIFGTGDKVIYPDFKLLEKLNQLGIGFEVMPIQALCRTYNFLISEDRKIACILFF